MGAVRRRPICGLTGVWPQGRPERCVRHANALQRFDREAKAAAKLNHANIISIYDYGVIGTRGAYMVMERLDGVTWRAS